MKQRSFALTLAAAAAMLLLSGNARADYPPACLILEVEGNINVAGQTVDVSVCGVREGTIVTSSLREAPSVEHTVQVASAKQAFALALPADLAPGVYTLVANGTDLKGNPVTFEVPIRIVAPNSPEARALSTVGAPIATAPIGSQASIIDAREASGSAVAETSKGIAVSDGAGALTGHTPAGVRLVGFGLVALIALLGLGALGFTVVGARR